MRLIELIAAGMIAITSARAAPCAEVKLLRDDQNVAEISLSGRIVKGDNEKLHALISPIRNDPENPYAMLKTINLQLDSEGGDYFEGINMARTIRTNGVQTWVLADRDCVSACAFMFLAGSYFNNDGITQRLLPSRTIQPGAHLGFHSPYNDLDLGKFDDGVKAIRALRQVLGVALPSDLFLIALETGRDETFDIEFVADILRWEIDLEGYALGDVPEREGLYNACVNYIKLKLELFPYYDISVRDIVFDAFYWRAHEEEQDLTPAQIAAISEPSASFDGQTFADRYRLEQDGSVPLVRDYWIEIAEEGSESLTSIRESSDGRLFRLKRSPESNRLGMASGFAYGDEFWSMGCTAVWDKSTRSVEIAEGVHELNTRQELQKKLGEQQILIEDFPLEGSVYYREWILLPMGMRLEDLRMKY
ncbi:hypothetical protein GR198_29305 [Rhizobium leguminosarum]|uniref:hypothetical protein n=1 Tax=Rhizobium leguminosarum TaxID=384 RepID=UPI0013C2110F|nr:hypothetical protein [Rhizobium leguminosarum]NEH59823.1 hypothetical protein [Rhizobium leguminosarum]